MEAPYLEAGDNEVTAASWYGADINPLPVDIKLSRNTEQIELGKKTITALHVPGHSPGSVVYITESDGQKVLFGQDVHGPLAPLLKSNRSDYEASLKKLISLEADILCEGHYGIYEGKAEINRFIASFLR
jgi:glyoxylase-like metal-dependent hydrolase (beta-lactamase superfamily II)